MCPPLPAEPQPPPAPDLAPLFPTLSTSVECQPLSPSGSRWDREEKANSTPAYVWSSTMPQPPIWVAGTMIHPAFSRLIRGVMVIRVEVTSRGWRSMEWGRCCGSPTRLGWCTTAWLVQKAGLKLDQFGGDASRVSPASLPPQQQ